MTVKKTAFFAYPGKPNEIAQVLQSAIKLFNEGSLQINLEGWEKNDISGISLTAPIFSKISAAHFLAADITFLNENVAFEIGYAIGAKKRCLLFVNDGLVGDRDLANKVGLFDTLGFEKYNTAAQLQGFLASRTDFSHIQFEANVNHQQPVYIVEPSKKNDAHLILVSRIKKARWRYRSFNPDEDIRLSAMDAIQHVAQSAGVVVPLQSEGVVSSKEHNIRAMFVAGLAMALEIPTLIIHSYEYAPPLDVRDLTKKYREPADIIEIVNQFSLEVTDFTQKNSSKTAIRTSLLSGLAIGDPTAENEMTTLGNYYLATDEYQRASRGEVNLVVGKKGAGKTALFVQLRDEKRSRKPNIVVDLKPEGYQLVKLKERVLDFLTVGAQQHLITAVWEYILLLEITYKVLEKDREVHLRDHRLTDIYQKLKQIYGVSDLSQEGDFRERLSKLADHLLHGFFKKYGKPQQENTRLNVTTNQITEILYQHDIRSLYATLVEYLLLKEDVWLLFDNIDKGWNVEGISPEDITILRCLINASRKIEREFKSKGIEFHSVVFVRDDVYTLLMQGSSDYGKEMRASLDWSDIDLLGSVLKKRINVSLSNSESDSSAPQGEEWRQVCVSHYKGEPWLDFFARRSLMRPRNLLKLFRYSLGYAINLGHQRIETEDITRGLLTYAQDLVIEVDRELSDVFPKAKKLIYEFSEENGDFFHDELSTLVQCADIDEAQAEKIIDFLLYYGVVGVKRRTEDVIYIYDVNYDIEMLKVKIRKWGATTKYVINPALWPALNVKEDPRLV